MANTMDLPAAKNGKPAAFLLFLSAFLQVITLMVTDLDSTLWKKYSRIDARNSELCKGMHFFVLASNEC